MPCQELFECKIESYKKNSGRNNCKNFIEAASTMGWKKYTGNQGMELGIDTFGKSAPYKKIYEHFKLTSNNIIQQAKKLLKNND